MSALETYLPLAQFAAFVGAWAIGALTGLLVIEVSK